MSHKPHPIKVVDTALSKAAKADEIAKETKETGKVTAVVAVMSIFKRNKPIGALPLTKCRFSHYLFWLRRILWGMGGGGLKKRGNAPWATESQRCKSSAS
jgi:hypothetical protein